MLKLYAPGTRKNNRFYIAKGYVAGREYEFVCRDADGQKTANRRAAEQFARAFERRVRAEGGEPGGGPRVLTFAAVADAYADGRGVSQNDRRYLDKLKGAWIDAAEAYLQDVPIGDVLPMHIAAAANALYRRCTNETKNRQAFTPAAAVLHYAAENRLRDYIVVRKLAEKRPETRRPAQGVAELLLANTEGDQRLLLLVLFYQGWRITETLSLLEAKINLRDRTVELWVSKAKAWQTLHLHRAVFEELANQLPIARPDGRVFPWRDRHAVYRWLRALCKRLGVTFTPHMARHEFGGALRELGAHPRDIADAGSWTSEKSTMRYSQAPARARDLLGRLNVKTATRGKTRGKSKSA